MSPRPAPDLDLRRDELVHAARELAESDGWPAVTMRRLAGELGVTQPVRYSAFASRQAREELQQLRNENARLRMEREILSKAAVFFAKESDGR